MPDPIATPADLGLYLGITDIDEARATLLIDLATSRCSAVVNPVPVAAKGIVLAIAARTYDNASNQTLETIGPYTTQQQGGGSNLTRDERRTLRRLAGRGGGFSIDPTPADVDISDQPWWDLNYGGVA